MDASSNPFLREQQAVENLDVPPKRNNEESKTIDMLTYAEIGNKLIQDNFVLTALELHTELQEIGRPLSCLRDYFSNPGNFERTRPPEIQSTSPPVGLRKYSLI